MNFQIPLKPPQFSFRPQLNFNLPQLNIPAFRRLDSFPPYPNSCFSPSLSALTLTLIFSHHSGFDMKGGKSKSDTKSAKLSVNQKATTKGGRKSGKAAKDPNKPKRPASAFFVFMEEFREQYKKDHPKNKSVAAVGKAGGDKWKSLSQAEKQPYVAKAEKRKAEYEKNMKAYNKKQAEGPKEDDVESEKSVSEVNDEEEDEEDGSGEEDDDE
ncbi:hypothetical protein DITRI_Ditri03aG0226700 [Diplodiscus trichospermus]